MTEQDLSNGGHAMDKQLQALQHNPEATVQRAMETCEAIVHVVSDQFRGITKLIGLNSFCAVR